jgi:hypothetical protein
MKVWITRDCESNYVVIWMGSEAPVRGKVWHGQWNAPVTQRTCWPAIEDVAVKDFKALFGFTPRMGSKTRRDIKAVKL